MANVFTPTKETNEVIQNPDTSKMTEPEKTKLDHGVDPIVYHDKDIKLGIKEADIRQLSAKNLKQLEFRFISMELQRLASIDSSLIDIIRLLLLLLKKLGVENVPEAIDRLTDELKASVKIPPEEGKKEA